MEKIHTYLPGFGPVCLFGVVVMVVRMVRIYQTYIISLNLPNYPKRKVILFLPFSAKLLGLGTLSSLPKVTKEVNNGTRI